jgi:hypothetical protein
MSGAFEQSADFSFKLYVAHNVHFLILYVFLKDQQNAVLKTKYNSLFYSKPTHALLFNTHLYPHLKH